VLRYRVLLNGRNFRLEVDGKSELHGFWTTRFVLASSPEEAATAALTLIQHDEIWAARVRSVGDPDPIVLVDEVERVLADESWPGNQPGLALYVDPDEPPLHSTRPNI
jgi:hypothetical protein